MISGVTMRINIDEYLMNALKEDITQEDVSTNAVMPEPKQGEVNLICKQDGVICGLEVFASSVISTFKGKNPFIAP